jgi:hypothetical protein
VLGAAEATTVVLGAIFDEEVVLCVERFGGVDVELCVNRDTKYSASVQETTHSVRPSFNRLSVNSALNRSFQKSS